MPEISDLLDRAAPGAGGPAPLDDIVRRGRRRQVATRAVAVATPVAAVAIVAAVILTGGGPTGVVIEPGPDVADSPDATPSPSPTPSESGETTEPPTGGVEEAPSVDTSGWVAPTGLAADVLVVTADGSTPQLVRLGADGTRQQIPLADGVPGAAGLLPDREGGFVWQPDWASVDPAPVLRLEPEGNVATLITGEEPGSLRLVGWDHGTDRPLVTQRYGSDFEDTTADLLTVPLGGGEGETVREDVGAWEAGLSHAAMLETALYAQYVEAMQNLVLDPPDGDRQIVYEAGEVTGEYLGGVALAEEPGIGMALVGSMPGIEGIPQARLLVVDMNTGVITDEIEVPLADGFEGTEAWPGTDAHDVSVADGHVLVNRRYDGEWIAPLVHDLDTGAWSPLEHVEGGVVTGRAFLAAPADREPVAGKAACYTDDGHLRNAEPLAGEVVLYLPCKDADQPDHVNRILSGMERTGDVENDLTAALDLLIQPLPQDDGLTDRGYYMPADRGQVVMHSVRVEDGHAVVDLGFPNGVGNLSASYAGAVWSNVLRGTVFQFPDVETLELRLDGSCEDYGEAMQAGPVCLEYDRDTDAPWNSGFGA